MLSILIVYTKMDPGGSTNSLINFLNTLDYQKLNVTLLLLYKNGIFENKINKNVYVINPKNEFHRFSTTLLKFHIKNILVKFLTNFKKIFLSSRKRNYYSDLLMKDFFKVNNLTYDIGISYIEGYPQKFLVDKVNAKKKISWIHTDLTKVKIYISKEEEYLSKVDQIILISDAIKDAFLGIFPKFQNKTIVIENLINKNEIISLSNDKENYYQKKNIINLVSISRIDFQSKAFSRSIKIINKIVNQLGFDNFHWTIVGSGPDNKRLISLVKRYKLNNYISLLGVKSNPYPFIKQADLFFLPSYYEGKPIVIQESLIIGTPVFITDFKSCYELVSEDEGFIVKNSFDGIMNGLIKVLKNPELIKNKKSKLETYIFSQEKTIEIIKNVTSFDHIVTL